MNIKAGFAGLSIFWTLGAGIAGAGWAVTVFGPFVLLGLIVAVLSTFVFFASANS